MVLKNVAEALRGQKRKLRDLDKRKPGIRSTKEVFKGKERDSERERERQGERRLYKHLCDSTAGYTRGTYVWCFYNTFSFSLVDFKFTFLFPAML